MSILVDVKSAVKEKLKDCSGVLIFDESGDVLYSSFEVTPNDTESLTGLFGSRDEALRKGIQLKGKRYEVHRHHPPLVYGRTMQGDPELSEGAAICRTDRGPTGKPVYAVVTYEMPNVSARIVPKLVEFSKEYLEA